LFINVRVGNPSNGRHTEEVSCLVDSGAVYSLIPGAVLRALDIEPHSTGALSSRTGKSFAAGSPPRHSSTKVGAAIPW